MTTGLGGYAELPAQWMSPAASTARARGGRRAYARARSLAAAACASCVACDAPIAVEHFRRLAGDAQLDLLAQPSAWGTECSAGRTRRGSPRVDAAV